MNAVQLDLLEAAPAIPEGFAHRDDLISPKEEAALIAWFGGLSFRNFEFRGYLGQRRTVSFGLHYDYSAQKVQAAAPIPDRLTALRDHAAAFAGAEPDAIKQALVTEYSPGAAIGWHRDRPQFGDIIGISFVSACRFRFRRQRAGGWERLAITLLPRSAYLMRGPARWEWQHSIPAAEELRYSVTFRTAKSK